MVRIRTLLMAFVLSVLAFFPIFTACSDEWQSYKNEVLTGTDIRYEIQGGEGYLRWAKQSGATGYNVYRSESRFGEYRLVTTSPLRKAHYKVSSFCYWYYKITAVTKSGEVTVGEPASVFSENTLVVSPYDDMSAVQAYIDEMHDSLETASTGQFSDRRFAIILLPGEYPELEVKIGYYTTVSGVGETPNDVTVGSIYVSTNVLSDNNSTCTFWRSAENLTVDSSTQWAVSQATSLRRIKINGNLSLSHPTGWSSGGFLANSYVTGTVNPGTQQQWLSRNDVWGKWSHIDSHNYVFSGCEGNIPASVWTEAEGRATVLDKTEKMAEKPFLIYDETGRYRVFVPAVQSETSGVTWSDGLKQEAGRLLSLDEFYIASERDTDETLNAALDAGFHLLFPPGHYKLNKPLEIKRQDTVVMGLGYATLEIADTNVEGAVKISDVGGVRLADLLVEAGAYSKNMVVVGEERNRTSHANNPIVLSNIYLRIGGVSNIHTETETALAIYANDTLGDNFWIWRADHSQGIAWEDTTYVNRRGQTVTDYGNPVKTGVLVEGDNVSCYALMVEHCQGYQTVWNGENGLTVMYQSETPYQVPAQENWVSENGKNGCASYKVGDDVTTHRAYGIGIYLVNYSGVNLASAIEVPENAGINMKHLVICDFTQSDSATISNVINDYGGGVGPTSFRRLVELYPLL